MAGSAHEHPVIEAQSSRASRWLRERRLRLALWIAILEGIVVAIRGDISRWTVVVIAALVLTLYVATRGRIHWDAARQIIWIVAASQVLALLVAILAIILWGIAIVLIVLFALAALFFLFTDLRRT